MTDVVELRPAGPSFNSHVREGVVRKQCRMESAEGATQNEAGDEGANVKYRPFGPES